MGRKHLHDKVREENSKDEWRERPRADGDGFWVGKGPHPDGDD